MYDYILFLRNQIIVIFNTMNEFDITLPAMGTIGLTDILFGFLALYIVTAVFWRGQRV